MIYDCFNFYNELDLLEIRFNILDKFVDFFVIAEANESFMGKPKEFYFAQNASRFSKWRDKIIHHKIDDFPNDLDLLEKAYASPNTGAKEHWWIREFYQKESLIKPLSACSDSDTIFVSDLDEIWNPETCLPHINRPEVYRPVQKSYMHYLNGRCGEGMFTGTRFSTYSTVARYGMNHFRTEREVKGIIIPNGGWHFANLSRNFDKYGDGHPDIYAKANYIKRNPITMDESDLPSYILENKGKLAPFLMEKN